MTYKRRKSSDIRRERGSSRIFDFEKCRSKLCKIFFTERDLISRGSQDYDDFWKFLRSYQCFQEKKRREGKGMEDADPRSGISFDLQPSDPKDLLNRIPYQDPDDYNILTESMIKEFQYIVSLYVDFLQREKLKKLKKLKESQSNLPISGYRNEIIQSLVQKQVVIIAGDTGCGKSTQVPQFLLEAGYEKIACTQPRRLACIALANRVAYETLHQFGTEVGYQIRFEKKRTDKTRILFITEGLLLRQVLTDPKLGSYNVVILDEVHERHLSGDFLLGIVKCLLRARDDLKVILMSATINIDLFHKYFALEEAPIIQVPGRLYPIELRYFPIPDVEQGDGLNPAPYIRILRLIDQKYSKDDRGDVLIFLSGHKEIRIITDATKSYSEKSGGKWIVLPLHSSLSLADQDKVFNYAPQGARKCIISTNIAETSITIDGVRFVVDSGKVKEMHYDPYCKMRRLKEFWICNASAEQRKGRAGRTGPGVCFRLYSEKEKEALAKFSVPEIQRVHLDSLVLQMISMGLPNARKFPFIEPPHPESLENAIITLKEQDAMNEDETLTVLGSMLSNLPVDVTIGKMLIMGTLFYQVESVLSLAGALSIQSPFTNDAYQNQECVAARKNLDSDHGDPITLLNSYREWLTVKSRNTENSRRWCKTRGLEEQRFYELTKLRNQFKDILKDAGLVCDEDNSSTGQSSIQRAARHGELKHLRALKREWHKSENSNKTKRILKIQNYGIEEDNELDESFDIKDIEFRLRHDDKKVRELMEGSKAYSYKDLTILKLILTSGLYPQLAISDEFNNMKGSGADQLFHTKVKPFNVLHPNSYFSNNPEFISVDGLDIVSVPGFPSKYSVSAKHQILIYMSLLETTKSYIMNPLRMPALPTLLLFSKTMDTDKYISRIVFDSWIELRFPNPLMSQNQVVISFILRDSWNKLLKSKLESDRNDKHFQDDLKSDGFILGDDLVDFIHHSEMNFSIRRLLPGDIKVLYRPNNYEKVPESLVNPFVGEPKINSQKGGIQLNDVLTYDCIESLNDNIAELTSNPSCVYCDETSFSHTLERMEHYRVCWKNNASKRKEGINRSNVEGGESSSNNKNGYFCDDCSKLLHLTSTGILRHKQKHRQEKEKT
ncbi:probable ATP-dependent RNA helicase DHX34 [Lepeophtheirus salmonis]|uniref:probable ATP-dependent RNA helicase DHX34 n=1 Tax=Lepeophtheirus salmonis TaxID=72036 RepID=UPI001AE9EB90|nr:probable ATP-dependent RNA helicase DHX34 [Lepeophtheirus salmonis]